MRGDLPLVIVQMGHPPHDVSRLVGEQPQWFQAALDTPARLQIVCPFEGDALPAPGSFQAAVISGSWSMVTAREAWSERTAGWIRDVMDAGQPLLGICYGHQLMSDALGGEVDYHPRGSEVGQKAVTLNDEGQADALLAGLPGQFDAFLSHEQSVLTPPDGAVVLGASQHDRHQIIRYSAHALSVQFHPEFSADIMRAIITSRAEHHHQRGRDVGAMLAGLNQTPDAHAILQRFVRRYCLADAA
ncbi:glutamine amidotransferase [Entomohabitans teleogrylli]|uniref:glutamine amidotransferase n=1 Tax=Entomohabitans teleogrylli TaxID=1384589 RepID=UPI00073D4424|nr:glutamine amidotransferase [Entomohabitans teleogrylli]